MHIHNLDKWKTSHDFEVANESGRRRTLLILVLTIVTMVGEIVGGTLLGSMALLADGWHMATHAAAFGITVFAYWYARKHRDNPDFAFSTGKVSALGGFASAVSLAVVALMMASESIHRLIAPQQIMFDQAILVAFLGLTINGVCVFMLHGQHHSHDGGHHDHNLKAAYFHVLADTLTSVLAIVALAFGKFLGWVWLDPAMGVVGALVISKWALGLLVNSGKMLLDRNVDRETRDAIISRIESDTDNRVVDLHAWHASPHHIMLIISIVTHYPKDPAYYKELLSEVGEFAHVTIEVNQCVEPPCIPINGER
ncbi:MAG: cation diffusion facilitator family transporter [Phycisphaerae bacterium]|jgi:cation diffusion facilitator family transporter|nr:cation diffusion facilitator family transporter [Phycisphaerae bacterium]